MLNQSKLWASLLLLGTFLAGATVGGVGVSALRERRDDGRDRERTAERQRPGGGGGERRSFTSQLTRELNLTETQRDSVRAILKRYDPAMRNVMESTRPAVDSLRRLIHAEITQVLTDEQRVAFQVWGARQDSLWQKRQREQREREKDRAR